MNTTIKTGFDALDNQLESLKQQTTKLDRTIDGNLADARAAIQLLKNQKGVIMTANKMFSDENKRLKIENERLFDEVQNLKTKLARVTFR